MRTPNCKHYDFSYTTYKGERRIYCTKRGGNQSCDACKKCKDKDRK